MQEMAKIVIGLFIIFAFATVAALLFVLEIPEGNAKALPIIFGNLSTMTGMIISYFFGSPRGSKAKDKTIGDIARGKVNGAG